MMVLRGLSTKRREACAAVTAEHPECALYAHRARCYLLTAVRPCSSVNCAALYTGDKHLLGTTDTSPHCMPLHPPMSPFISPPTSLWPCGESRCLWSADEPMLLCHSVLHTRRDALTGEPPDTSPYRTRRHPSTWCLICRLTSLWPCGRRRCLWSAGVPMLPCHL